MSDGNGDTKALTRRQAVMDLVDRNAEKFAGLCTAGMDAERIKRCFGLAVMRNPDLLECDANSIIESVATAARLGLDPSGTHNSAHIVPFNANAGTRDNPRWIKKATLIPGYGGLIDVACRTGDVHHIDVEAVYPGDEFRWQKGTRPEIMHVPAPDSDRLDEPLAVYAVAWYRDGGCQFAVMTHAQVERVRQGSKSKDSPAWKHSWPEMAKKTAIRRLMKILRLNPDAQEAVSLVDTSEGLDHGAQARHAQGEPDGPSGEDLAAAVRAKRSAAHANAETDPDTGERVPSAEEMTGEPIDV